MGSGVSKPSRPVNGSQRGGTMDTFMHYIQDKPFDKVTKAALTVQTRYRGFKAKKKLNKLKSWKQEQEESASRYLADMKDNPASVRAPAPVTMITSHAPTSMKRNESPRRSFLNSSFSFGLSAAGSTKAVPVPEGNNSILGALKSIRSLGHSQRPSPVSSPTKTLPKEKTIRDVTFDEIEEERITQSKSEKVVSTKKSRKVQRSASFMKSPSSRPASGKFRIDHTGEVKASTKNKKYDVEEEEIEEETVRLEKLYPFIGFVFKTKFQKSQKKVFINVCHNSYITEIVHSPFREYLETKNYDEDGYIQTVSVGICDVILPSTEFYQCFRFQEGVGIIPKNNHLENIKSLIAEQCIQYLNTLSHCLDENNPPIATFLDPEEYMLEETYKIPKTKKMYYGTLNVLYYNRKEHEIKYYHPLSYRDVHGGETKLPNRHPVPDSEFQHYFIDFFHHPEESKANEIETNNNSLPAGAAAALAITGKHNSSKEIAMKTMMITNQPGDPGNDPKKRHFPPDIQYQMSLTYTCIKGEFDPKNSMKALVVSPGGNLRVNTSTGKRGGGGESKTTAPVAPLSRQPSNVDSVVSNTTPIPGMNKSPFGRNFANNTAIFNLDDDDEEDDIPTHQKEYLANLAKAKNGLPVYMDLSFGIMTLYMKKSTVPLSAATSSLKNAVNKMNNNADPSLNDIKDLAQQKHKENSTIPFGESLILRMALSNYHLSTSYDVTNQIFYLHLENNNYLSFLGDDNSYNPFHFGNYMNEISENIDLKHLTFQFNQYTELMTFQLFLERHIYYCNYCSSFYILPAPLINTSVGPAPITAANTLPAHTSPNAAAAAVVANTVPPTNNNNPSNISTTPILPLPMTSSSRTSFAGGFSSASTKDGSFNSFNSTSNNPNAAASSSSAASLLGPLPEKPGTASSESGKSERFDPVNKPPPLGRESSFTGASSSSRNSILTSNQQGSNSSLLPQIGNNSATSSQQQPPASLLPAMNLNSLDKFRSSLLFSLSSSPTYLLSQMKFDGQSMLIQPPTRVFSFVERYSTYPLNRQKLFFVVDKGLMGVFNDEAKITPNWKFAEEIVSLKNKRIEVVVHKKIIRLRKFLTKIHFMDDRTQQTRGNSNS
jgi:hypothetical protein